MAPSVQGKWPWPFPADPAGPRLSARPSPSPTGVSCLCSARPAPSPGDSLAGGEEVTSSTRRWSSPWDPAERRSPLPPASNIWLGGRHVGITGGQGGLRSQMASEMCVAPGPVNLLEPSSLPVHACDGRSTGDALTHCVFLPFSLFISPLSPLLVYYLSSFPFPLCFIPPLLFFLSFYKCFLSMCCVLCPILGTEDKAVIKTNTSAL